MDNNNNSRSIKQNGVSGGGVSNNSSNSKQRKPSEASSSDNSSSEQGFFRKAIPVMPRPLAVICCFINILLPGLGTFISSFSVFLCAKHNYDTNLKAFLVNFLAFFLQLCSAIIIFGWIWSIKYGLLFIQLSKSKSGNPTIEIEPDLPLFVRRHSSMDATLMYSTKPRLSAIALAKVYEHDNENDS